MADGSKTCTVDGCDKGGRLKRGLCEMHYRRLRIWGEVGSPQPVWPVRKFCSVDGCDAPCTGHGYCARHYRRFRLYGDPLGTGRAKTPPEERFWRHVDKDGPIPSYAPHLGACWLWLGAISSNGYGVFSEMGMAHRFAYELLIGPIPPGLYTDHLCRVRHCVNPTHLEPVTNRENILRSPICPIAENARKTHCPQGHEYTAENTYRKPRTGYRECRTCNRDRQRAMRQVRAV